MLFLLGVPQMGFPSRGSHDLGHFNSQKRGWRSWRIFCMFLVKNTGKIEILTIWKVAVRYICNILRAWLRIFLQEKNALSNPAWAWLIWFLRFSFENLFENFAKVNLRFHKTVFCKKITKYVLKRRRYPIKLNCWYNRL